MPLFTTSVRLLSASENDVENLSQELQKKSFRRSSNKKINQDGNDMAVIFSTNQLTMLDVSTAVTEAASHTGKKFSFSIMKEKAL
jgi:hypothetical protein